MKLTEHEDRGREGMREGLRTGRGRRRGKEREGDVYSRIICTCDQSTLHLFVAG